MERLDALVSGRVQLVMYRDFACRNARGLGLVGFAQNLSDGTVHVIAEGNRDKLDEFVLKLWKGPLLASVDMVQPTFSAATEEFKNFRIVY